MFFILIGVVFSFPKTFCLSKFCEENGKTYQFEGVKKYSWTKAAEHCKEYGGTLAYVRSFFLEPCISNTLGEIGHGSFSIGGKKHPSRNWTWMDDTPITQPSYWARGEPNNVGGNENCLQFKFYGANFHWNDVSCNAIAGFICQFNFSISESTLPELPEQTTLYEESFVNFDDDQSTKYKTGQQATISTTDDQSVTSTTSGQSTTSTTSGQSTTSTTSSQSKTFTQETSVNIIMTAISYYCTVQRFLMRDVYERAQLLTHNFLTGNLKVAKNSKCHKTAV
ncbi:macrophage mannose receptor 1-like isoform X2 [Saccostrea cucullata]|uniref:macrophage mannose receptor 1-like isoform X2 n=1 Tax=Saccostrea cuccullata TaxID=36930 RepID=UPI002ED56B66